MNNINKGVPIKRNVKLVSDWDLWGTYAKP